MHKEVVSFSIQAIDTPLSQSVEDLASEIHESNRVPDPYVFVVDGKKLRTPNGDLVERAMETKSYLGRIEYIALQKIASWASENDTGLCVWFSPPYADKYPVSKFIVSELMQLDDGVKVLFNRAVVLDIDDDDLVGWANDLIPGLNFVEAELLRSRPLFPDVWQINDWLDRLSEITTQVAMMQSGEDLLRKRKTVVVLHDMQTSVYLAGEDNVVGTLYTMAWKEGLMGTYTTSCPTITESTPFETMFNHSLQIGERKTLKCTCPFCKQKVEAKIEDNKIHCPKCHKSALYKC